MVARENHKRSIPRMAGIIAYAIAHAKMVAVCYSREIARVEYLGQKIIIGSGRVQKL